VSAFPIFESRFNSPEEFDFDIIFFTIDSIFRGANLGNSHLVHDVIVEESITVIHNGCRNLREIARLIQDIESILYLLDLMVEEDLLGFTSAPEEVQDREGLVTFWNVIQFEIGSSNMRL
jgi:hypothetical protein